MEKSSENPEAWYNQPPGDTQVGIQNPAFEGGNNPGVAHAIELAYQRRNSHYENALDPCFLGHTRFNCKNFSQVGSSPKLRSCCK